MCVISAFLASHMTHLFPVAQNPYLISGVQSVAINTKIRSRENSKMRITHFYDTLIFRFTVHDVGCFLNITINT